MKRWKDQSGPAHSRNKIKAVVITGLKRKAVKARLATETTIQRAQLIFTDSAISQPHSVAARRTQLEHQH